MIRTHHLAETSTFLGQTCALCKQEFVIGDEIVICPEDGSRHHAECWHANGDKCTAYGCTGAGRIGDPWPDQRHPVRERPARRPRIITQEPEQGSALPTRPRSAPNFAGSKVRTLPAGNIGCARSCLALAIILIIIFLALACFGLWGFVSYISDRTAEISNQQMMIVSAINGLRMMSLT